MLLSNNDLDERPEDNNQMKSSMYCEKLRPMPISKAQNYRGMCGNDEEEDSDYTPEVEVILITCIKYFQCTGKSKTRLPFLDQDETCFSKMDHSISGC